MTHWTYADAARKLALDESGKPLNITDSAGFFRGIEIASNEEFATLVNSLIEMRKTTEYSNQDCDRQMRARKEMSHLTAIGKMPIKKA